MYSFCVFLTWSNSSEQHKNYLIHVSKGDTNAICVCARRETEPLAVLRSVDYLYYKSYTAHRWTDYTCTGATAEYALQMAAKMAATKKSSETLIFPCRGKAPGGGAMWGCGREWREGRECGGRRSGGKVRRVIGTCGTNLKPIDICNATQKVVVRGIKRKKGSTNL